MGVVVILCKQQPPPLHTRSEMCNSLLVPIHASSLLYFLSGPRCPKFLHSYRSIRTAGLCSSSVLGRLSHTPQLVSFPLFDLLLSSNYISTHIYGLPQKGLLQHPMLPGCCGSSSLHKKTNAYLLYVWYRCRKQNLLMCYEIFYSFSVIFNNRWPCKF